MVHRSSRLVISLLAVTLALMVAAPVSAYSYASSTFLRLSRLDALTCGTQIEIQATLTSQHGPKQDHPLSGTVSFAIVKGSATLAPASVVTSAAGTGDTFVTITCTNATQVIQIVATGPDGAQARITLTLPAGHANPAQLARAPRAL